MPCEGYYPSSGNPCAGKPSYGFSLNLGRATQRAVRPSSSKPFNELNMAKRIRVLNQRRRRETDRQAVLALQRRGGIYDYVRIPVMVCCNDDRGNFSNQIVRVDIHDSIEIET